MSGNLHHLQYPIGTFDPPRIITDNEIRGWIQIIEHFPSEIEAICSKLDEDHLNLTYRPEGWTIAQVIHHCADSHMHSYIRFKLALTEENPTIKPYFEDRWAALPDVSNDHINLSIDLLKSLHSKWVWLLKGLSPSDLDRTFEHPEHGEVFTLKETIGTYAWHCQHHLAHIQLALKDLNN